MPHEFHEYAELWQEQIDAEELAQLQAMAKNIERTARRKRLIDFALALAIIVPAGFALWTYPASPQTKAGFALAGAVLLWGTWRRQEITRASRATAIHDPRVFFQKAIRNLRAEINFSTISLCLAVPALVSGFLLMNAARGRDGIAVIIESMHDERRTIIICILGVCLLAAGYYIRDNIKLRGQLRRLESMSREWDEQQPADLEEGP